MAKPIACEQASSLKVDTCFIYDLIHVLTMVSDKWLSELQKRTASVKKGHKVKGFMVAGRFTTDPKEVSKILRLEFRTGKIPLTTAEVAKVTITINDTPYVIRQGQIEKFSKKLKRVL